MKKPKLRIPVAPPTIVHKDKRFHSKQVVEELRELWDASEKRSHQNWRMSDLMDALRYLRIFDNMDY